MNETKPGRLSFWNCVTVEDVRRVREQLEELEAAEVQRLGSQRDVPPLAEAKPTRLIEVDNSPEAIAAYRAAHPKETEHLTRYHVLGLMFEEARKKARAEEAALGSGSEKAAT